MVVVVSTTSSDQALQVSRIDAEAAYSDLSGFRIQIALEPDGWHIQYELKNPIANGGGPHYVIDSVTGTILSKKYYQ